MINKLTGLALFALPLFYVSGMPIREAKDYGFVFCVMAIGLSAYFKGSIRPFRNRWALLFILWLPVSAVLAPRFHFMLSGIDSTNFWTWKPILFGFLSVTLIVIMASINLIHKRLVFLLRCAIAAAVITSLYMILQAAGIDPLFHENTDIHDISKVTAHHIFGFMGHPTMAAPLLVMMLPILAIKRQWMVFGVIAVAVFLTQSAMAAIGLITAGIAMVTMSHRTMLLPILICCAMVGGCLGTAQGYKYIESQANGRIGLWQNVAQDFQEKPTQSGKTYKLTGFGPGAFRYAYPMRNGPVRFVQAHCEPLELLYTTGFIGLFLCAMAVWRMFRGIERISGNQAGAIAALVAIGTISLGTFVFQNGAILFYTCVLIGLLHNESFIRGSHDTV